MGAANPKRRFSIGGRDDGFGLVLANFGSKCLVFSFIETRFDEISIAKMLVLMRVPAGF